ncbi:MULTISPECIES: isochorismatase family protein [unclassified Nocardioides]|uniref:isochorismatase family protein n=1 Tax=unclassified Nocardioides TaxID=2615069 RepID=UPI0006F52876|nr:MULTISPECIES: isochorismatase family protein [unclassified Nocardioides]KQY57675.1 isochorismatase [Nocardioides sp. Root140]KQZ67680.1 isochorismatase [Nocardioides sp. Root151]KRF13213.1 isochorismatase [Nocardioides sp. Soil796]
MTAPRRALILVDVQQEYFEGILQIQYPPREESLANIVRAIDAAEQQGLPVVAVQHQLPEGAPVFAVGSPSWQLHPEIEKRATASWKRVTKSCASVFAGTDVASWLAEQGVDSITVVGFMTNNCDVATAVAAEELGLSVELLSDATGAIHLANEQGKVEARRLHETLLTLLHSNFAAVATTDAWLAAVESGAPLPKSNLGTSAVQGRAAFSA